MNFLPIIKVHQDGSISLLCDQVDYITFCMQYDGQKVYSCEKKAVLNPESYYFLWEPNLPAFPVSLAREFNIANGLCFVERHSDAYELIAFATPVNNLQAVDIYLNHLELLGNFIQCFRETKAGLIKIADKHRIVLGPDEEDINKNSMFLHSQVCKHKTVYFQEKCHTITLREYDCLTHLSLGKTAKEIAKALNISFRSVETYLERVKIKTGCRTKVEQFSLLSRSCLSEIN